MPVRRKPGSELNAKEKLVASALRMLQDCTPVAMTEEFGARAANKLRAWRLRSAPPGTSL